MAAQNPLAEVEEIKEVKKKIQEAEEEIKEVKEKINNLKEGRSKDEYASDPEYTRAQDSLACKENDLAQLLKKENRLSSQDLDEAVLRALKRHKASESVALSSLGATEWGHIMQASGVTVLSIDLSRAASSLTASPYTPFKWSDEPENKHSDRYMLHLGATFPIPDRLAWLEGGDKNKDLLDVDGNSEKLFYSRIRGNTDAAIVSHASMKTYLPSTGLYILFELRKRLDKTAMCQAMGKLLAANILSSPNRPVVVVTDLNEDWNLLWVDKATIRVGSCMGPVQAVAIIQALVAQAAARQDRMDPGARAASSSQEEDPGMPAQIAQRQCLDASFFVSSFVADTSLADLEGLLPSDELRAAQATATLQHLLRLPQLSFLAACSRSSDAPADMDC